MSKLNKILKYRVQREQEQASELSAARLAREQAESQQQTLGTLAEEYCQQFAGLNNTDVGRLRQYSLFYGQLSEAVMAQQGVVDRLTQDEQREHQSYIALHQERRALEQLLEQRDRDHKIKVSRSQRRAAIRQRRDPLV